MKTGMLKRRKKRRMSLEEEAVTLPNLLTYGRIAVIPPVAYLLYLGGPVSGYFATFLYALAAATDYLDGYLARKRHLVTTVGKFLDPLADKLLVISIVLVLIIQQRVPLWVAIIMVAREITITALRALAGSEGLVIAAEKLGKYKTAFQMTALVGLMIHYEYIVYMGLFYAKLDFHRMGLILLYISLVFSILSAFDYFIGFIHAHRERVATEEALEAEEEEEA
jgi:CDP-diacylglycerol---glycerol-3-phosphate 3-phosphatidyltransferase